MMNLQAMYVQWGKNVRQRREELLLTQRQLAELCQYDETRGTDQSTISRIEKGIQAPSDDLKFIIAAALQVRVRDLFDYGEAIPKLPRKRRTR